MAKLLFNIDQINKLFPFYFLIDQDLCIVSLGTSLMEKIPGVIGKKFYDIFDTEEFFKAGQPFPIKTLAAKEVFLKYPPDSDFMLYGQFEQLHDSGEIIFIGKPWIESLEGLLSLSANSAGVPAAETFLKLLDNVELNSNSSLVNYELLNTIRIHKSQQESLEERLRIYANRMTALFANVPVGMLVENEERKIEIANQKFCEILGIPMTCDQLAGTYQADLAKQYAHLFRTHHFVESNEQSVRERKIVIGDTFQAHDGRTIQCDYFPIWHESVFLGSLWIYIDITESVYIKGELQRQKEFYEQILSCIPSDIVVFNADHEYVYLNPGAIKDPELREWMVGKTDMAYCLKRNKPLAIAIKRHEVFEEALNTKKRVSWEEVLVNDKAEKSYHYRNFFPVLDPEGNVEMVIGYGLDITDRMEAEIKLKEATTLTEEMAEAKARFLTDMAHEIRTPLNGILGTTSLLRNTSLDPDQASHVKLLDISAKNLQILVNDVLDLEKIVAGKLKLENSVFNVLEKVKTAVSNFQTRAAERGMLIKLFNKLPGDMLVSGDPFRLIQILNNLISNAIKFTERGTIMVTVGVQKSEGDASWIYFKVRDNGIGIPAEKLAHIFEPHVQARGDISRKYGGTGLGLTICQSLVNMQGGQLTVESEEGKGSLFKFTIPYKMEPNHTEPTIADKDYYFASFHDKRVLVAEDVEINQYIVRHFLQEFGCEFDIVDDGSKAVEKLAMEDYDVVLMDLQMPVMSGLEATQTIRHFEDEKKASIPIVALTANALPGVREECLQAGMNAYLSKPFTKPELFRIMQEIFKEGSEVRN